jgi:hypothetical protein
MSRRTRGIGACLAAFAVTVAGASAHALEHARARLRYAPPPPTCPDGDAFRRQVMARLGYDPFAAESEAPTAVDVRFALAPSGYFAELVVTRDKRTTTKRRDAPGESCAALAESVATTVAMALDPIAATYPSFEGAERPLELPNHLTPADQAHAADEGAAPRPLPVDAPAAPAPAAVGPPWKGYALATGGAGIGELPGGAFDASLAFEVRRARFGAVVDVRGATTLAAYTTAFGDRIDASVLAAGPGGCLHVASFSGCVHLRFGAFRARAENVVVPTDARAFYAEAAASGRVRLTLSDRFELHVLAEALAPLRSSNLQITEDQVWSAPPCALRLGVGEAARIF